MYTLYNWVIYYNLRCYVFFIFYIILHLLFIFFFHLIAIVFIEDHTVLETSGIT